MNIADELQRLEGLRSSGAINEDEYAKAKALVLSGNSPAIPAGKPAFELNALKKFSGLAAMRG